MRAKKIINANDVNPTNANSDEICPKSKRK